MSSLLSQEMLYVKAGDKVVIGDTAAVKTRDGYNLFVQNGILTEKVKVALHNDSEWSDDAFESVPELPVMEKYIAEKSHLLGMPSASHLVQEGYEVTGMDAKLLQQIEWLWMQLIHSEKENARYRKELDILKQRIDRLEQK